MIVSLADLQARHALAGKIDWIGLRPGRQEDVTSVAMAEVSQAGLAGDRARIGPRALTLIQAEHLPVIAALCGRVEVSPDILRRNLVVSGINLLALKDRDLRLGTARIRLTVPCHPCSRMEAALGFGGYNAMRGHGGWCAEVLDSGRIALGDRIVAMG